MRVPQDADSPPDHLLERARRLVDGRVCLRELAGLRALAGCGNPMRRTTHRVPSVRNSLALPLQVAQNVRAHILGLERDPVCILEPS